MAGTKRRSTRQAATRKRSIYVEPETDDDFEAESDGEDDFQPEEPVVLPPHKKRKTVIKTRSKQRSIKSSFKIGKPRKINSRSATATGDKTNKKKGFTGPSDGKIPKWTSLPVNILRDIFVFASQPIHEFTNEPTSNVSWLMSVAHTCRAFALPALEAFYQSPALLTTLHPHQLLDLLQTPKEERFIDYNVKTQSLLLHIQTLAYVAHNKPSFDLKSLVTELPQLQHMEILHPRYLPPYRTQKLQRWTFVPSELFDAMESRKIHLKSWRWSRDTIPQNAFLDLYGEMNKAHGRSVFAYLRRLSVCGFNWEDSSEPTIEESEENVSEGPATPPPGLATAIAKLPALEDLTFVSCDVVMDKFLQRLPTNLQRLELSNCLEITSDMIRAFYKTSASQLRELVLNHNAALSLSFLTGLKEGCPRLQVLKVDMHYYSEKVTINDAEAFYDALLLEDEVPTWPSSLTDLVLVHAQKWSPEAAQNLFRSLIDSAPELPNLRNLVLQAHINIPWRDRVGFRDQWIERLRRVYLAQSDEPSAHLGSLRQYRLWKQAQETGMMGGINSTDELAQGHTDEDVDLPIRTRKTSRVQTSPYKPFGDTEVDSDIDVPMTPAKRQPRRSKRVAQSQVTTATKSTPEASNSESEGDEEEDDWRDQPEKFIHGMCRVVDIRIDNQRPTENQFTEGDFLDSEVSGDDDWHEGADSGGEESYAW